MAAAVNWSNTMGPRAFCFPLNASFLGDYREKLEH